MDIYQAILVSETFDVKKNQIFYDSQVGEYMNSCDFREREMDSSHVLKKNLLWF